MLLRQCLPFARMIFLVLMFGSLAQGRDLLNPSRNHAAGDACETMVAVDRLAAYFSSRVLTKPSEAEACFDQNPFDPDRDLGILDNVVKSIRTYYVFAFQVESNPDPLLPGGYPLLAMLADLRGRAVAGTFSSARKFHEALEKIIRRANDGHLRYDTGCFTNIIYGLPVSLIAYRNSTGHHVVEVANETTNAFVAGQAREFFDFDVSEYVGAKVLTIGGEPPQQHLEKLGTELGHAQPRGARYNSLLTTPRVGWFGYPVTSIGAFARRSLSPGHDTLTVELHRSDWPAKRTVVVPWLAYTPSRIVNVSALLEECNTYSCSNDFLFSSTSKVAKMRLPPRPELEDLDKEDPKESSASGSQSAQKPKVSQFVEDLETISFFGLMPVFLLPDNITAVISIPRFSGPFESDGWFDRPIFVAMKEALQDILADGRAEKLLLDVRGNPGGDSLEARLLAALLMGSAKFPRPNWYPRGQIGSGSPFVEKLVRRGVGWLDGILYQNPNQIPYDELSDYFLPVRQQQRYSGKQKFGNYSKFYKIQEASDTFRHFFREDGVQPLDLPIAILTDGTCTSACALFISTMSQEFKVPVVMVTSLNAPSQSIHNTHGGLAISAGDEICRIPWDLRDDPGAPQPFTNGTDLYVNLAQLFVPSTERLPADFKYYPPTVQIFHTYGTATNLTSLWIAAAKAVWV